MPELSVDTLLLLIMVITGLMALLTEDLLAAVILFSAFSFFAVLMYLVLQAPDVAFTEAVVGIVSTSFFIVALKRLGRRYCKR